MFNRRSVLALVITLAAASVCHAQLQTNDNPVIVTVNGEEIHLSDVGAAAQGIAESAAQNGMNVPQDQIFQMATAQVVDATLLAQEAKRLEIAVTAAQTEAAMADIEESAGGKEGLMAALADTGMSYNQLRRSIEKTMLARAYVDKFIRPEIVVSNEELQTFYQENPQAFAVPEQVKARHILIKVSLEAPESEVADARTRADEAHARAVAGEDFAALAKELSEGPSAPRGGDLGWIAAEQMVEPFATVAFGLEPGSISEVVRTRYGFHVILVEGHREPSTQALADVVEDLRAALVDRAIAEKAEQVLDGLREKATIVPAKPPAPTPS